MALADHFERHGVELLKQLMDEDPATCSHFLSKLVSKHELIRLGPCPCRKLHPAVMMMKSAEDRLSGDLADPLDRPMARRILIQGQTRSEFVVIAGVGGKDSTQMGVAEDNDVIETFPPDRADQSLRMSVLPG